MKYDKFLIEQLQLLSGWRLLQLQLFTSWIGTFFTAAAKTKHGFILPNRPLQFTTFKKRLLHA